MSQLETQTIQPTADKPLVAPTNLPSPIDYPQADVVIYDGLCVFCCSQVKKLLRFDGKHRLAFTSLHDEFVKQHFPDLTYRQMMDQMFVVPNSESGFTDERFGGAAAIRYFTRRLPKLWIFAPLMHIPFTHSIQQWVYSQVAKRRYKIAGKKANGDGPACDENGTCKLHIKD